MKQWLKCRNFSRGTTVWGRLYKTSLLKENNIVFDENIKIAEDLPFNMQTYIEADRISQISYCGYYYLQRNESAIHQYLNKNYKYLIDNKCNLAIKRDVIAAHTLKKYNYDITSTYAGSLVLSCGEIAVSLAKDTEIGFKEKVKMYKKYSQLSPVKKARKEVTLSGLSFKNKIAIALIKFDLASILFLGLKTLNALNISIGF